MSMRRWIVLGGAVVVVMVALLAMTRPRSVAPSPRPTGSGELVPAATSSARPPASSTVDPGPSANPTSGPTGVPTPRASASILAPAATAPPRATGDPRLAWAEFLLRVNDDRGRVEDLNGDLAAAAERQDLDAVRTASVAILDFVDGERDWLREHPPAECYAAAHASAIAMVEAYGTAADRFITWSLTGGGLAGLAELGQALDAAQQASEALTAFGAALQAVTCRA